MPGLRLCSCQRANREKQADGGKDSVLELGTKAVGIHRCVPFFKDSELVMG